MTGPAGAGVPGGPAEPGANPLGGPGWQRLHPLSVVVRGGRAAVPLVVLLALTSVQAENGSGSSVAVDLVLVAVVVLIGLVHWLVTRWAFDGTTLQIETGLVRRDSLRLPVSRIQAVEVVEPFLAHLLGLAELKIRVVGVPRDSRLAYLRVADAQILRAALLAAHHGVDVRAPEPAEVPLVVVPPGRLAGSVLLSAPAGVLVLVLVGLPVLAAVSVKAAGAFVAVALVYLVGLLSAVWRRFNAQYGFTVATAPDGIRIRRGLVGTVAETVPVQRVQALRQVEPLWWRVLGWCRLEVDLAGAAGKERGAGPGTVTKTLLPVGPPTMAAALRAMIIGAAGLEPTRPPRRARYKSPFSYHFLAAGHDDSLAVAVTGRLRKTTCWVPLVKTQSVRRIQGPVQRRMGLATVRLDVAGRRVDASFRDREVTEADRLVDDLAALSRLARHREPVQPQPWQVPVPAAAPLLPVGPAAPPGWFADPSGRHAGRWWDGTRWTEHVDDYGAAGTDPV